MHTMVVRMSIDPERADEAARHLREDVVAWARQQPGFVNGQWLRSPDGSEGNRRGRVRLARRCGQRRPGPA
jgi:Antibiotic biosynthesis monooxygenase.